jgi:uridine kinase
MNRGILIGIAGASGSGKTLVTKNIYDKLGSEKVVILQEDSYYKDLSHIPFDERTGKNFDHPDAFDHTHLINQIEDLLSGQSIKQPIYDYTTHSRKKESRKIGPHDVVFLEGILVLSEPRLRKMMDIKVFVDTDPDICFIRRLKRDLVERGRDVNSIINQYTETVRPMYFQFIEPSKRYSDIIIPEGGMNKVAIDILTAKIRAMLNERGID